MTLEKTLLQKLAEKRSDTGVPALTVAGPGGWTVALDLERNEGLAARVRQVGLTRSEPVADLKGWAERLCARATGLLEPLKVVEIDATRGTAQLRSQAPSRRDEALSYYEVLLHGKGEASVRRYSAVERNRREQVGFALTHEVLARLVEDLIAAV